MAKSSPGLKLKCTPNKALLKALAKGWYWQQLIDQGKFSSAKAIAKKYKLHPPDVCRMLQMNLLSPKLKRAILDGTQPRDMDMQILKKPWPDVWQEQLKYFGTEQPSSLKSKTEAQLAMFEIQRICTQYPADTHESHAPNGRLQAVFST